MTIIRGQPSIGFSNRTPDVPTLPSAGQDTQQLIEDLSLKLENLTTIVEAKADKDKIKTLIAYSNETILIQAQNIVLSGEVTIANIIKDQNGTESGVVPATITRIIGDKIRTGAVISNNWGDDEGSYLGLDDGILVLGGSVSPSFIFEDGDLTISGKLTASSIVLTKDTTLGEMADAIENAIDGDDFDSYLNDALESGVGSVIAGIDGEYILEVSDTAIYARHELFDESGLAGGYTGDIRTGVVLTGTGLAMGYNQKSDGAFIPAVAIDATGQVSVKGTIVAGSIIAGSVTVNGTELGTVETRAEAGFDIQQQLEVAGTTVLQGFIVPTSSGGIKIGTITWDGSGDVTGGTGIGMTPYGFVTASSGTLTFALDGITGDAFFAGDISGATGTFEGEIKGAWGVFTGSQSEPGGISGYAVAAAPGDFSGKGVIGRSQNSVGGTFETYNGTALEINVTSSNFLGSTPTGSGIIIENENSTTYSLWSKAGRFLIQNSNASATMTISNSGAGFALVVDNMYSFGSLDLRGNILLGSAATDNGANGLVLANGTTGARLGNQIVIMSQDSSDAKSTLAIVVEEDVVAGTGPLNGTGINQMKIRVNGSEFYLPVVPIP